MWSSKKIKQGVIGLGVVLLVGDLLYVSQSKSGYASLNRLPTTKESEKIMNEVVSYRLKPIVLSKKSNNQIGTPTPVSQLPSSMHDEGQISSIKTQRVANQSTRYTVEEGDSLAQIALEMYGDERAWMLIVQANNIASPDEIETGMVLKIPRSSRSRN